MVTTRACIVLAMVLVGATSTLAAQSASGDVQGTVTSGSGAPVAGVTMTITDIGTRAARETITGADGWFAVTGLPAGSYEIQASHQQYATRRHSPVTLHPGQVVTLRVELVAAPDPETIMLGGPAPMVEFTRSHPSSIVDAMAVEHLPIRRRSALELSDLAAGSAHACDGFAAPCVTSNRVIVDGADRTGTTAAADAVSQDAVESLTVKPLAYPPGYGRAAGAIAAIATRSGSNRLTGSLFAYHGNTALSAKTATEERLEWPEGGYSLNQFGGGLGGPIVEGRHFGFGMYDGRRETVTNSTFLNIPPDATADAAGRAAFAELSRLAGPWERPDDEDEFLVRTDHQFSDRQRLMLRYRHLRASTVETGPFAVQTARDAAAEIDLSARGFEADAASVVGSTIVNEARLQIARDREAGEAAGRAPQAVIRHQGTEVLRIGANPFALRESTVRRLQLADTLTVVRGAHTLRAGLDLLFDDVESALAGNFAGAYTFGTLAGFGRGVPSAAGDVFAQAFEQPGTPGRLTSVGLRDYALFAHDEWRAIGDLTFDLGVRYEGQSFTGAARGLPDADANNLAPRLGAAWAPADSPLVVRGAYAIAYGRTPWTMAAAALGYGGGNILSVVLPGARRGPAPRFPSRFASPPEEARASMVGFAADYESSATHHASIGVDWEWMRNTALAVSYLFARGNHLPRAVEIGSAAGRAILFESTATSRYDGIAVELLRRFSQGHQYRVSYTLGRAEDTMPVAVPIVPETDADRGVAAGGVAAARVPANHDRRHRFVGTLIYDSNRFAERYDGFLQALFRDWMLSGVYTLRSGLPFTAYVAGDLNGDGNRFNDIAPGTTRNGQRLAADVSADVRLARAFGLPRRTKATLILEAFNLLDRTNYVSVNDTMYAAAGSQLVANPLFGQMLDQRDPRRMRVAVRFAF